ncbi:type II secretion system F family protein [Vibrio cholerae]
MLLTLILSGIYFQLAKKRRIEMFLPQNNPSLVERFHSLFADKEKQDLEDKFIEAGIYNVHLARFYLAGKVLALVAVGIALMWSGWSLIVCTSVGLVALIVIIVGPDAYLSLRKKAIIARCSRQLPYMLDMMAICVQTGMTIEASLAYLSVELKGFDKDLCYHIKVTSDAAKVKGLAKALYELGERIPTNEVRSFTMMLIQNIQFGTSIAQVLSELSEDMRKHQLLTVEEKIGKLAAKMSIPLILLIMFPIVVLILAPGFMMLLKGMY